VDSSRQFSPIETAHEYPFSSTRAHTQTNNFSSICYLSLCLHFVLCSLGQTSMYNRFCSLWIPKPRVPTQTWITISVFRIVNSKNNPSELDGLSWALIWLLVILGHNDIAIYLRFQGGRKKVLETFFQTTILFGDSKIFCFSSQYVHFRLRATVSKY
jgi:hypothetical protein